MLERIGPAKSAGTASRFSWIMPGALVIASAVPIVLYRHPPMMDVPNHLARIWLEAQQPLAGVHGEAYAVDWSRASSNILVDLVGAVVMRLIGLDLTWLSVTLLMVLGPAVAAICISRQIHGRDNPWQALALATAWGQSTIAGFVSFTLSLGLALTFCLANLKLSKILDVRARCLVKSSQVLAIYLTHPFGIALFFAFEFAVLLGPDRLSLKALDARRLAAAFGEAVAAIAATALYVLVNRQSSPLEVNSIEYRGLVSHLVSLVSPFFAYDGVVELSFFGLIAVCVLIAALRSQISLHVGLTVSAIILCLLSLLIPDHIGNASLLTRRLPLMAALLTCMAIRQPGTTLAGPGSRLAFVSSIAMVLHVAWIGHVWRQREQDYVDLYQAARQITPESRVLVVLADTPRRARRWSAPGQFVHGFFIRSHLPALLVPLSHSYVPTLFAIPGQQPLVVKARYQGLQAQISDIPTAAQLVNRTPPFPSDRYLENWECAFDYLLFLKPADLQGMTRSPGGRLLMTSRAVDLYKLDAPMLCRPTSS